MKPLLAFLLITVLACSGADTPAPVDANQKAYDAARALLRAGKYDAAEKDFQAQVDELTKTLGPEHRDTLHAREGLAAALLSKRKYADAETQMLDLLPRLTRVLGAEDAITLKMRSNFARYLLRLA